MLEKQVRKLGRIVGLSIVMCVAICTACYGSSVGSSLYLFKQLLLNNGKYSSGLLDRGASGQSPDIVRRVGIIEYIPAKSFLNVDVGQMISDSFQVDIQSELYGKSTYSYSKAGKYRINLKEYDQQFVKFVFSWKGNINRQWEKRIAENIIKWPIVKIANVRPLAEILGQSSNKFIDSASIAKLHDKDVIYIVLDAFAARHSSSYGYKKKTSPFLDELASHNIIFENMYAVAPYTIASTGSLFTSNYSFTHGLGKFSGRLRQGIPTIMGQVKKKGVESYLITGHGFFGSDDWGLTRGFDEVYYRKELSASSTHIIDVLKDIYRNQATADKRKFIYIHIVPPHRPYTPPEKYRGLIDDSILPYKVADSDIFATKQRDMVKKFTLPQLKYVEAMYDSNIFFADSIVREIFEYLEEKEITKKSVLFVTSDHGEEFLDHGAIGHYTSLFNEQVHIPCVMVLSKDILHHPLSFKPITSLIDMAPTIADIFDVGDVAGFKGQSLLSTLAGQSLPRQYVFIEMPSQAEKGVISFFNYKFVQKINMVELYDLDKDPREKKNIVKSRPYAKAFFLGKLEEFGNSKLEIQRNDVPAQRIKELNKDVLKNLKELGYIR